MNKQTIITILILLGILLVAGYFSWQSWMNAGAALVNNSAIGTALTSSSTAATFTDLEGEPAQLNQYLGKPLIVHAWASWVPTSPQSLADFDDLQQQYVGSGLTMVAINRNEPIETARQFLQRLELPNLMVVLDNKDQYFKETGGRTMPETIFYKPDGSVMYHHRGVITKAELQHYADKLITSDSDE